MKNWKVLLLAGFLVAVPHASALGEEASGWRLELVSEQPNLYQGEEIKQAAFEEDGYVYVTDKVVAFFDQSGNLRSEVPLQDAGGKWLGRAQVSDKGGLVAVEGKPTRAEDVAGGRRMHYYTVRIYNHRGELLSTFEVKGYHKTMVFEEGGYLVKYGAWPGVDWAEAGMPYFAMYDLQGNALQDMKAPGDIWEVVVSARDVVAVTSAPGLTKGPEARLFLFRHGKLAWEDKPRGSVHAVSPTGGYLVAAASSHGEHGWRTVVTLLDAETGNILWEYPLDGVRTWTAAVVRRAVEGEMVLLLGDRDERTVPLVTALDALTHVPLWTTEFHVASAELPRETGVDLYVTPEGLILVAAIAGNTERDLRQWSILLLSREGTILSSFSLPTVQGLKERVDIWHMPLRVLPDGHSFLFWGPGKVVRRFKIVPPEEQRQGLVGGSALTPTQWNEFDLEGFPPSEADIASHVAVGVPEDEKATCESRLRRALQPNLCPPDLREHLLPLKDWDGKNIFLTRCRVGDYWIQVTEGGARLTLEVRRVDGQPPVPPGADPAMVARDLAQDLVSPPMQPKDFHTVVGQAPRCATWATSDQPDARGFLFDVADVYADSLSIRYRFHEIVTTSPAFPGVPLYTFAPPAPKSEPPADAPWPEPIPQDLQGFPGSVPLEGEVN